MASNEEIIVTDEEWSEYKKKFQKVYVDEEEDKIRRELYLITKIKVRDHNKKYDAKEVTFSMGINQFADNKTDEHACQCQGRTLKHVHEKK